MGQGFGATREQPFRFIETCSYNCPVPGFLRSRHAVIAWVDLRAGRAQNYDFEPDGCGALISQGVNGWISHCIIARAISSSSTCALWARQ